MFRDFFFQDSRSGKLSRPAGKTLRAALVVVVLQSSSAFANEESFSDLDRWIEGNAGTVRALIVADSDRILHESYFHGAKPHEPQRVHSVTKSVLSLLVGIALKKGMFPKLSTTLGHLYPDQIAPNDLSAYRDVRLDHLLSMTGGQLWQERGHSLWVWASSLDRRNAMLQLPVVTTPGATFRYNTGSSDLLGHILADHTGQPLHEFAARNLFAPLGIENAVWLSNGSTYDNAGAGLILSPRDLAKIGQLVLNRGRWGNRQVVPAEWIDASTAVRIPVNSDLGYGYQWWRRNLDDCAAVAAWGRGGQFIIVIPERNLVTVVTSVPSIGGGNPTPYWELFKRIADLFPDPCSAERRYSGADPATQLNQDEELAKLPDDVRRLFEDFILGFRERNLEKVMRKYSSRFSAGGVTKAQRRPMWRRYIANGGTLAYAVDSLHDIDEDIRLFHGTVYGDFGSSASDTYLIREDGEWLFLGDRDAGSPLPVLPTELEEFLDENLDAHEAGDMDRIMALVSDQYLSNGVDKAALRRRLAERPSNLGLEDITVRWLLPSENGYQLRGDLAYSEIGRVPMQYLYGHIGREMEKLRWIGNQQSSARMREF